MNENHIGPNNLLDTTDCLEAVGVIKGWKNFFFVIVILCLLLLQTCFVLVDAGVIEISGQADSDESIVSGEITEPEEGYLEVTNEQEPPPAVTIHKDEAAEGKPAEEIIVEPNQPDEPNLPDEPNQTVELPQVTEPNQPAEPNIPPEPNQPAELPEPTEPDQPAEPNEAIEQTEQTSKANMQNLQRAIAWLPGDFLLGITFEQLTWLIRFVNATLILTATLYCLTMLFSLKVSMLGRLGGINHISRAFFLSLLMLVLLLPWQKIFGGIVFGAIYTPDELVERYSAKTGEIFGVILYYLRFSGYWLLIMLLLILSQFRSLRWAKAILRRLEII